MNVGRTPILIGVLAGVAMCSAACASDAALGLARQACTHVNRSVSLYQKSLSAPAPERADEQQQAVTQLEDALPQAATAAGEDPEWQALMTDIGEISRVPESDLVESLTQLCQVADSAGGQAAAGAQSGP